MHTNLIKGTAEDLVRVGRQALPSNLKTDDSSVIGLLLAAVATMIATAKYPPPATFYAIRDLSFDEVATWAEEAHARQDAPGREDPAAD